MKVAIVEDEPLASTYLKTLLEKQPLLAINDIVILDSVKQATTYFQNNSVDLIFMDIHLGDGKSLEIFEYINISAPIIFITAYDHYALEVFKQFTLDYILKPFEEEALLKAIEKFKTIAKKFESQFTLSQLVQLDNHQDQFPKNRFLVHNGYKLKSISSEETAYFQASGKHLFLYTNTGECYIYEDTLTDLSNKLDPKYFFKINRKYLIHINSIQEIRKHSSQKLEVILIPSPEDQTAILVSKNKINELKTWLNR